MMNFMDRQLISLQSKWSRWTDKVKHDLSEERGASDIVAVILLIVIVVSVALIFQEKLTEIVKAAFETVTKSFPDTKK